MMPDSYMDAHTQGIGELIQHGRFFRVPEHQRDFAWTDEEVEQFLDDVIAALQAEEEDYFLGLIVLVEPQQGEVCEILDGQQRLATTTMVYAAIREWLYGAGYEQRLRWFKGVRRNPGCPMVDFERQQPIRFPQFCGGPS